LSKKFAWSLRAKIRTTGGPSKFFALSVLQSNLSYMRSKGPKKIRIKSRSILKVLLLKGPKFFALYRDSTVMFFPLTLYLQLLELSLYLPLKSLHFNTSLFFLSFCTFTPTPHTQPTIKTKAYVIPCCSTRIQLLRLWFPNFTHRGNKDH
jgi:hypothetical protein